GEVAGERDRELLVEGRRRCAGEVRRRAARVDEGHVVPAVDPVDQSPRPRRGVVVPHGREVGGELLVRVAAGVGGCGPEIGFVAVTETLDDRADAVGPLPEEPAFVLVAHRPGGTSRRQGHGESNAEDEEGGRVKEWPPLSVSSDHRAWT